MTDEASERSKVLEMIRDIRIATLVTRAGGRLKARPMSAMEADPDGALWFFTHAETEKAHEVETEPDVLLAYSAPDQQRYVTINGRAELRRNRALVRAMWREPLRTWFPKGPEDPELALIRVMIEAAEYWDGPSSRMVFAYGYLKARLTGEQAAVGEHGAVEFPR